mmetsp:Transcript_11817/g.21842  ORF Transcript_11817/g.21842 Transcript_11817/m.21842 type:complete len:294 (+) Transcript_11817:138-1019(+)|eukprot:CAMPEP_0201866210 /NCGR_PEP_ID=MMETSP0902-20130614/868_1 /ASSEMBLY_ACC=CAM_ASM_000551 /TAXON_ID=420261 /ORGANISM="Thalassiosira antarctica, Strain CCMP982" /LENGTH=293 /DNA_ID=CAMNT_0048391131 /DNA_START=122 /DNA_END=1003 /DNA_ORIENTATION=+
MCEGIDTLSQQHEKYRRRGDIVYGVTLLNTLVFCVCVMFFKDNTSLFDSVWAKDGFCISNPTVPFWSSHDLCLYADLFLAAVCGVAYFILHNVEGMKPANDFVFIGIFGVVAHGLGHGGLGAILRDEKQQEILDLDVPFLSAIYDKPWAAFLWELFSVQGSYLIFWLFLLKASMPQTSMRVTLPLSVVSWLSALSVKPSFQFTFVQTILLIAFSLNQLCRKKEDKGFAYSLYGLIVSFPLVIVGWIESTMCSSTIIHVGGHLCYDAYIPLSMLAFYLTCYVYRTSETAKLKAD